LHHVTHAVHLRLQVAGRVLVALHQALDAPVDLNAHSAVYCCFAVHASLSSPFLPLNAPVGHMSPPGDMNLPPTRSGDSQLWLVKSLEQTYVVRGKHLFGVLTPIVFLREAYAVHGDPANGAHGLAKAHSTAAHSEKEACQCFKRGRTTGHTVSIGVKSPRARVN
jgi:hypothetical protein